MRLVVCKDDRDWVQAGWDWSRTELEPGQRVFIPAGATPTPLYSRFRQEPTELLRRLTFVQIDEILNGPKRGTFRRFFETELNPFHAQIEMIENADRSADAAILGVGINGHVAFHEPRLPRDFGGGCVRLSRETLDYLHLDDPTWGVTYGVATLIKVRSILVVARGGNKAGILKRALKGAELPITWILHHPNVTLLTNFDL
jgi:6-phosphogluconolactonase/glucosamine-6-phosphate isomerase/deaminase